jgi:hypothetical protein
MEFAIGIAFAIGENLQWYMAFESTLIGRVYAIRWHSAPDSSDLQRVLRELPTNHQKAKERLINISIVPESVGLPEDGVRSAMTRHAAAWEEHCEVMHIVIEGSGFRHSMLRSAMAVFALGYRRGTLVVHRNAAAAVARAAKEANTDALLLERRLRQLGYFAAAE